MGNASDKRWWVFAVKGYYVLIPAWACCWNCKRTITCQWRNKGDGFCVKKDQLYQFPRIKLMNLAQTSCKRKRVHFLISFCFTRPKYTNSSKKQDEISSRNDQSCEGAVIWFPPKQQIVYFNSCHHVRARDKTYFCPYIRVTIIIHRFTYTYTYVHQLHVEMYKGTSNVLITHMISDLPQMLILGSVLRCCTSIYVLLHDFIPI